MNASELFRVHVFFCSHQSFLFMLTQGGHAKTLMFINVSPCAADADESLCSLQFASRVRKVELGQVWRGFLLRWFKIGVSM